MNIFLKIVFNCGSRIFVNYPLKSSQVKITVSKFYNVELQCINHPSECWSKPKLSCQENLGLMYRISLGIYSSEVMWTSNQMHVLCGKEDFRFTANLYEQTEMRGAPSNKYLTSTNHLVPLNWYFIDLFPACASRDPLLYGEGSPSLTRVFPFSVAHGFL